MLRTPPADRGWPSEEGTRCASACARACWLNQGRWSRDQRHLTRKGRRCVGVCTGLLGRVTELWACSRAPPITSEVLYLPTEIGVRSVPNRCSYQVRCVPRRAATPFQRARSGVSQATRSKPDAAKCRRCAPFQVPGADSLCPAVSCTTIDAGKSGGGAWGNRRRSACSRLERGRGYTPGSDPVTPRRGSACRNWLTTRST